MILLRARGEEPQGIHTIKKKYIHSEVERPFRTLYRHQISATRPFHAYTRTHEITQFTTNTNTGGFSTLRTPFLIECIHCHRNLAVKPVPTALIPYGYEGAVRSTFQCDTQPCPFLADCCNIL